VIQATVNIKIASSVGFLGEKMAERISSTDGVAVVAVVAVAVAVIVVVIVIVVVVVGVVVMLIQTRHHYRLMLADG